MAAARQNKLTREEQVALCQRAVSGDASAFDELHRRYDPRVRSALYTLVPRDDVDDMSQTVWIQVYRKLATWNATADFTTWLHQITINFGITALRKNRLRKDSQSLEETFELGEGSEVKRIEPAIDARFDFYCDLGKMYEAIDQLPPVQRVIALLWLGNTNQREIAETLEISLPSVKSHVFRLAPTLRAIMNVPEPAGLVGTGFRKGRA